MTDNILTVKMVKEAVEKLRKDASIPIAPTIEPTYTLLHPEEYERRKKAGLL